jgi:soluble lytic murein transglycosylase-like protein
MKKKLLMSIILGFFVGLFLFWRAKTAEAATTTTAAALTLSTSTVAAVNLFEELIDAASGEHDIPIARIKAHIAVESAGNANAVGGGGEVGLMQMTTGALSDVNDSYLSNGNQFSTNDMYEPRWAIFAGVAYLRLLYEKCGDLDTASKAYNVGLGNVDGTAAAAYLSKIKAAENYF